MRLPGDAWLEWHIEPHADGVTLVQTARFHPRGLLGRLYWYAFAPAHQIMFPRMLRGIAEAVATPAAESPATYSASRPE